MRRFEEKTGLAARFLLPVIVGGIGLDLALLGLYWDIAFHIDEGRDEAVATLPHILVLGGIAAVIFAGFLHAWLPGRRKPGEVQVGGGRASFSAGGLVLVACSGVVLIAFALDDAWHELFGEDLTLWSPSHLLMVAGAGTAVVGLWLLMRDAHAGEEDSRRSRADQFRVAAGLTVGVSAFQAEFDFGVPQFPLVYHPLLLALAAGVALVSIRTVLGPGSALKAVAFFIVVRALLAIFVGPVLGHTTPRFPLYVVEALVVELAALVAIRSPLRFALLAGTGIGSIGFAAEWGWSHVWMTHPWTGSMLPEALLGALLVGSAGALLGARIGLAFTAAPAAPRLPRGAAAAAVVVAAAVFITPLPRTGGDGTVATMAIAPAAGEGGEVDVAVELSNPGAAEEADWFEFLSWQGKEPRRITPLRRTGPGRYASTEPVPAGGSWKTLLRLTRGSRMMAVPLYLPAAPESDRGPVAARSRSAPFAAETYLLQREVRPGHDSGKALVRGGTWAVALLWLMLVALALRRNEPKGGGDAPAAAGT
jgi:hypothetical protein